MNVKFQVFIKIEEINPPSLPKMFYDTTEINM